MWPQINEKLLEGLVEKFFVRFLEVTCNQKVMIILSQEIDSKEFEQQFKVWFDILVLEGVVINSILGQIHNGMNQMMFCHPHNIHCKQFILLDFLGCLFLIYHFICLDDILSGSDR